MPSTIHMNRFPAKRLPVGLPVQWFAGGDPYSEPLAGQITAVHTDGMVSVHYLHSNGMDRDVIGCRHILDPFHKRGIQNNQGGWDFVSGCVPPGLEQLESQLRITVAGGQNDHETRMIQEILSLAEMAKTSTEIAYATGASASMIRRVLADSRGEAIDAPIDTPQPKPSTKKRAASTVA
jgi:hypothetical protein